MLGWEPFLHPQNTGMVKFSDRLPAYSCDIDNVTLQQTLHELAEMQQEPFKILEWDANSIAIPVDIAVELPPLGNYNGIDIREEEPVLFVFDKIRYPSVAPRVFADRVDFPKTKLAHLYIAKPGRPPGFCYVRGNNDEWYANKRIQDLSTRISNWLRDAATGELAGDGSQFEPLRLEGYSGTIVFDHDTFSNVVSDNKTIQDHGSGMALALFERSPKMTVGSYQFVQFVTANNVDAVMNKFEEEKKKGNDASDRKPYFFGYLLWSNDPDVYEDYEIDLPKDWESFKLFCDRYGIDWRAFENFVAKHDQNTYVNFPVIVAIKRPKPLIGFSSNIEFVTFRFPVDSPDTDGNSIVNNVEIDFQAHNQPLTFSRARMISNLPTAGNCFNIVFGCGALGSKIIMHQIRSGRAPIVLVDPDTIAPHNMVRHALLPDSIGVNKAQALVAVIEKMYPTEKVLASGIELFSDTAFTPEKLHKFNWIMDFTASHSFFNKLVLSGHLPNQIVSASITDFGNLGILYVEGRDRNPRIDDLAVYLFSLYNESALISDWLKREKAASEDGSILIQVGVGCNSETTVLADDKISTHAAYFSGVIQKLYAEPRDKGRIFLSRISDSGFYTISTEYIQVEAFDVIPAVNDDKWEIRFKNGILNEIQEQSKKAGESETGGVFVGMVNHKTKVIHVTGLIAAPLDSKATSTCFWRGHDGLSEDVAKVTDGTGGQLGYIGEWHSHPIGPNWLSDVDMEAARRFKSEFEELTTPLPVFLTVVAPAGVLPFVF